jgi:hypothetical protein
MPPAEERSAVVMYCLPAAPEKFGRRQYCSAGETVATDGQRSLLDGQKTILKDPIPTLREVEVVHPRRGSRTDHSWTSLMNRVSSNYHQQVYDNRR